MASRIMYPTQALNLDTAILGGVALVDDSSASVVAGRGYSIEKTGTGLYRINLEDKWNQLIWANFTVDVKGGSAADLVPQILNHNIGSTDGVHWIDVHLLTVATATDPSAPVDIHFNLFLSNTSVPQ